MRTFIVLLQQLLSSSVDGKLLTDCLDTRLQATFAGGLWETCTHSVGLARLLSWLKVISRPGNW